MPKHASHGMHVTNKAKLEAAKAAAKTPAGAVVRDAKKAKAADAAPEKPEEAPTA